MAVTQQQIADSTIAKNAVAAKQSKALEDRKNTMAQLEQLRSTLDSIDKSLPIVQSAQSLPDQSLPAESLIAAKQTIQSSIDSTKAIVDGMNTSMVAIETELAEKSKVVESQAAQLAIEEQTRLTLAQSVEQNEKLIAEKADAKQKAIDACSIAMQSVFEVRQKSSHLAQNRPLSPEQLGLSILQSTDVLKNYVAAEMAELEKQAPLAADASPEVAVSEGLCKPRVKRSTSFAPMSIPLRHFTHLGSVRPAMSFLLRQIKRCSWPTAVRYSNGQHRIATMSPTKLSSNRTA